MFKKITSTEYVEKEVRDDQSDDMNLSTAEDDECFYDVELDIQPESPGLSQDFQLSFVEVSDPIEAENDQVEIEKILQEFGQPHKHQSRNPNTTDHVGVQSTIDFTDLQQKSSIKNANQMI